MSPPSGGSQHVSAPKGSREEPELETYERLVSEGHERLDRPLLPLLSTGLLGGVDVGVGVLMYLVVDAETGNPLLASTAFTIGFVALLLANSELFTENFLVPVTARGRRAWVRWRSWSGCGRVTLAANLVGGFAMAAHDRRRAARTCTSRGRGRLATTPTSGVSLALVLPRGAGRRRDHAADADAARDRRASGVQLVAAVADVVRAGRRAAVPHGGARRARNRHRCCRRDGIPGGGRGQRDSRDQRAHNPFRSPTAGTGRLHQRHSRAASAHAPAAGRHRHRTRTASPAPGVSGHQC